MIYLLRVLIAIAFGVTASAAEKIEGAFGLKLGDLFEPSGKRFRSEDVYYHDAPDAYEFTPKILNPAFSTYVAFITPNTRRIYCIVGICKFLEEGVAHEEATSIRILLHRKYGDGPFEGISAISQESRDVIVTVASRKNTGVAFRVTYTDRVLAIQASEERLNNKLEGANAIGL